MAGSTSFCTSVHHSMQGVGMKSSERFTNLAILATVLVFVGLLADGRIGAGHNPGLNTDFLLGSTISIPGIDLPSDRPSLVIVISTQCLYCKESTKFYREVSHLIHGKVETIAVLPETRGESARFLKDNDISIDHIISASPRDMGVRETPTLILMDKAGRVQDIWTGELGPERQRDLERVVLSQT